MAECHPVGFRWVMEAKRARRDDHPRRPALHPHQRGRRSPRADPRRLATSRSSAASSTTSSRTSATSATTSCTTPTPRRSSSEEFRIPKISTACSAAGTGEGQVRHRELAVRGRRRRVPAAGHKEVFASRAPASRTARRDLDEHRDETLQHPRCVFQIAEAPFRALHAGDGRGDLRHSASSCSCASPRRCARTPGASARPRSATRSAGRSTPSACSTSAPPRSSSCCSATSAGPAAASWRCAATRPSRARPTSRRCTTCCPAICRCRTPSTRRTSTTYIEANQSATGWWSEFPKYVVSLLKAWFGEHATQRQRLVLRLPAAAHRRPLAHDDRRRHGRRQGARATSSWARTRSSAR